MKDKIKLFSAEGQSNETGELTTLIKTKVLKEAQEVALQNIEKFGAVGVSEDIYEKDRWGKLTFVDHVQTLCPMIGGGWG